MIPCRRLCRRLSLVLLLALSVPLAGGAEEGMWLFNEFPARTFEKAYGFVLGPDELDTMRLAAVIIGGGSGSFVSPEGLVLTNHHVGDGCIQDLSTAERDLFRNGFVAARHEDELRCPGLEVYSLVSIERVTEKIRKAEAPDAATPDAEPPDAEAAARARDAVIAELERECGAEEGADCEVVSLFGGGQYDLYRYRLYTDVRLAFAPEIAVANFGGNIDNFEYPRYCLDFALFRIYGDDGKPVRPERFLRFSTRGPVEGEPAFLFGNPGSSQRYQTLAQLTWLRDVEYPFLLLELEQRYTVAAAYAARGPEQARIAGDDLDNLDNALKGISGFLSGLLDEELMAGRARQEEVLQARLAARPELAARHGDPWREIAGAYERYRPFYARLELLNSALLSASDLTGIAARLVRLAGEEQRSDGERLPSYREADRPTLELRLLSGAPIYPSYEEFLLAAYLRRLTSQLGAAHPLVDQLLTGTSPEGLAARVMAGTKLADIEVRRALLAGGQAAIDASDDPLIRLVAVLEPAGRKLVRRYREEVESAEAAAETHLASLRFELTRGEEIYPDATGTLRLSFGRVVGYEQRGESLPWATTFPGLFARSRARGGVAPFALTPALAAAEESLSPEIPVDFVSTHDITGGNSGSPVTNRQLELIGVVFDGNRFMLPNRWVYSERQSRAISVSAPAMLAVLSTVYPAGHLARELVEGTPEAPAAPPASVEAPPASVEAAPASVE